MPSFDVVSELNLQEIDNAVNQALKEVAQRFDFRGVNPKIELDKTKKTIQLAADDENKIDDIIGVLQSKAIKRSIDIRTLKAEKKIPAGGKTYKCTITLIEGIDKENAKKLVKHIKDLDLKVQASIHEEKVRVTAKKRDDLQEVMQALRAGDFEVPLQFDNFRD